MAGRLVDHQFAQAYSERFNHASNPMVQRVLVLGLSKGGVPASTRVYTVAPDGKSMTETMSALGPDGQPTLRTNYFTK